MILRLDAMWEIFSFNSIPYLHKLPKYTPKSPRLFQILIYSQLNNIKQTHITTQKKINNSTLSTINNDHNTLTSTQTLSLQDSTECKLDVEVNILTVD